MTTVHVEWANVPFARKLFAVYHWRKPDESVCPSESVLVIPDRWTRNYDDQCTYLMTETERVASGFSGRVISVEKFPHLDDGDIVLFDARINSLELLFEVKSRTNSLYVTNACNSHCQFCPQPSSADDGVLYATANEIIDLVKAPGEYVNVTGGEPTINREAFLSLLSHAARSWTETTPFVLTNGRNFRDGQFVTELFAARADHPIGFGIPLYADSAVVHDQVVGVTGAFGQTIKGLYNLAVHRPEIEIRFVLSRLSYMRLPNLIEFIGRSIPFVTRVSIMGLEPMGYCRARWNDFWIDPSECGDLLLRAVEKADNYGVDALLYNFQLCCLPPELWHLARPSISEWKRTYQPCCLKCPSRTDCGGFFASQNRPEYLPMNVVKKNASA